MLFTADAFWVQNLNRWNKTPQIGTDDAQISKFTILYVLILPKQTQLGES